MGEVLRCRHRDEGDIRLAWGPHPSETRVLEEAMLCPGGGRGLQRGLLPEAGADAELGGPGCGRKNRE